MGFRWLRTLCQWSEALNFADAALVDAVHGLGSFVGGIALVDHAQKCVIPRIIVAKGWDIGGSK
jgi:hypothetical protein